MADGNDRIIQTGEAPGLPNQKRGLYMAIISFDKDAIVEYVPAYSGNRNSDAPCVVRLKFVPYSRVQHYARLISAKAKGAAINEKIAEIAQEIQKKQFVESVESIEGYLIGAKHISSSSYY